MFQTKPYTQSAPNKKKIKKVKQEQTNHCQYDNGQKLHQVQHKQPPSKVTLQCRRKRRPPEVSEYTKEMRV